MSKTDIVSLRRKRLQAVIDQQFKGCQANVVRKHGINAGELSGLLRDKHFGEKKARTLEAMLDLPNRWLDNQHNVDATPEAALAREFAQVYAEVTADGQAFLRNAIEAARLAYQRKPDLKLVQPTRSNENGI